MSDNTESSMSSKEKHYVTPQSSLGLGGLARSLGAQWKPSEGQEAEARARETLWHGKARALIGVGVEKEGRAEETACMG